jgi:hypothetical protein
LFESATAETAAIVAATATGAGEMFKLGAIGGARKDGDAAATASYCGSGGGISLNFIGWKLLGGARSISPIFSNR